MTDIFFPPIQDRPKNVAHQLSRELVCQRIIYEGITENATPTEIFIDNAADNRLTLPPNGVAIARWMGAAFNITDGVGTTHGDVVATSGAFSCKRAGTAFVVGPTAISGTGFVFTANDTLDAMVCTVTGVASKTILWVCAVDIVFAGPISGPHVHAKEFVGEFRS
jgi:hypothetical protein